MNAPGRRNEVRHLPDVSGGHAHLAGLLLAPLLVLRSGWATRLNKALNDRSCSCGRRVLDRAGNGDLQTRFAKNDNVQNGDGPFPLVINHGKGIPAIPGFQPRAAIVAAREFVRRGYAVMIPMRGGFRSRRAAISKAAAISPAMVWRAAGYRRGAGACAYAPLRGWQAHRGRRPVAWWPLDDGARRPRLGRGARADQLRRRPPRNRSLHRLGKQSLVEAFADYGKAGRYRSLWFYSDSDSYWPKRPSTTDVCRACRCRRQGPHGGLRQLQGRFAQMFSQQDGLAIWWPEVEIPDRTGLAGGASAGIRHTDPDSLRLAAAGRCRSLQNPGVAVALYQLFVDADYRAPLPFRQWALRLCL